MAGKYADAYGGELAGKPLDRALLACLIEQAARTRRPPLTPRDLATLLGRAGVPGFADELLRRMASPSTAPDRRGTT